MISYRDILGKNIGKKIFLKRKSTPNYTIVGTIEEVTDQKVYVCSEKDSYLIDFEDVLSLDIKSDDHYYR